MPKRGRMVSYCLKNLRWLVHGFLCETLYVEFLKFYDLCCWIIGTYRCAICSSCNSFLGIEDFMILFKFFFLYSLRGSFRDLNSFYRVNFVIIKKREFVVSIDSMRF